jgi:hypothetical protein
VAHISRLCSNLQALELTASASDCAVQLSDLTFSSLVTHAPHLRRLACGVQANQFSDHGIARLAALSHLDSLSLASLPSVGNAGLAAIATMTTLTVLELGHVYVASAAGFAKLAALTNPVELRLSVLGVRVNSDALHVAAPRRSRLVSVALQHRCAPPCAARQPAPRRSSRLRQPHDAVERRCVAARSSGACARREGRPLGRTPGHTAADVGNHSTATNSRHSRVGDSSFFDQR